MSNIVNLNKKFLSGGVEAGIEVTPPDTDAQVVAAFAGNTSFPYRQIDLGTISAKAEANQELKFGNGSGQVVFKGSASTFAGLGVYTDPAKLLAALEVGDDIAPGMNLENDPESLYLALRWGYDLSASAKGSIALGGPSVTFSASGEREALYAVVRRLDKDMGALTAVGKTATSWMLPSQIEKVADLEPGTWLIAEVEGSAALSLGVQYGYDFNWVREAKALGLSGDIGMQLKLGVSAAVNFTASGNLALVVGRESADETLRFRLFRLRKRGVGVSIDAGASVQGDFSKFLPEFDEFIKAVFGVHGAQVVKDLQLVKKWTNPETSLGELLSGAGVKYGEDFLAKVARINPGEAFDETIKRLSGFIKTWNELPHDIATRLWKVVEKNQDLVSIREIAKKISDGNLNTLKTELTELLSKVDFFSSPVGAWLETAAVSGIFNAINSSNEFAKLQEAARKTLGILDGSDFEGVLKKLQAYVEEHLNLDTLFPGFDKLHDIFGVNSIQDLDQVSFAKLDTWLKARLAAFINKELKDLKLDDINKIRESIFLFVKKSESFYAKTVKALNTKYDFNFAYSYQSTTTRGALLDFTLEAGAIDALKLALNGEYDKLLVEQLPGVKLNVARLTHQIQRHSHVEINLPWFKSSTDHINESLAQVDAVDNDGGRLLIYELAAKDIVEEKNKRLSRLAIGGFLQAQANQVRVHSTDELTYAYTFRQVKKNMKRADLDYQLGPYVQTYFGKVLNPDEFKEWADSLGRRIEPNGQDNFGNTLIGLNLSLPAEVASAWLTAPAKSSGAKVPAYLEMSRRLQAKLKEILPLYYFANLDNYNDTMPPKVLLAYAAIPPSTYIRVDDNGVTFDQNDDYYWDYTEPKKRERVVLSGRTKVNLIAALERIHPMLEKAGMAKAAKVYNPDQAEAIQRVAAKEAAKENAIPSLFWGLVYVENEIVKAAREAGYDIAKFTDVNDTKPSEAVKALANFGSKLTAAFNEKIKSSYGGGALRPLGTAMFIEAASVLKPGMTSATTAMLDLTVLKQQATFDMTKYLSGEVPEQNDILVRQPVVAIP
ncbi:MAG TPA: hypothetical protein VKC61_02415 [Pyrinomonadaceae bacterium]|nr:hypothetical protein [Pyrinomonadaceae bacterium]